MNNNTTASESTLSNQLYNRQTTLLVLSRTRIGKLLLMLVASQAKKEARTKEEAKLFAGAASYITLEKMVFMSKGKLSWKMVDSIIDIANGNTWRVVRRIIKRDNNK